VQLVQTLVAPTAEMLFGPREGTTESVAGVEVDVVELQAAATTTS
jgi:hypothetical protein